MGKVFHVDSTYKFQGDAGRVEKTIRSLEPELDFAFKGPGFYMYDSHTILVVPNLAPADFDQYHDPNVWIQDYPEDQNYLAFVYEAEVTDTIFGHLAIPVVIRRHQ
jgi:hypothetical protein